MFWGGKQEKKQFLIRRIYVLGHSHQHTTPTLSFVIMNGHYVVGFMVTVNSVEDKKSFDFYHTTVTEVLKFSKSL